MPPCDLIEGLHGGTETLTNLGGSIDAVVRTFEQDLRDDMVGIVGVPPAETIAFRLALHRSSLHVRAFFLPWPTVADPAILAAHDRRVLAAAQGGAGLARQARSTVLRAIPLTGIAINLLPSVAVVQASGGCYGRWLLDLLPGADPRAIVVRRRARQGCLVQAWGRRGAAPVGWVKRGGIGGEAQTLRHVAAGARAPGVRIPKVVGEAQDSFAITPVAGTEVARLLEQRPARAVEILPRLGEWLSGWYRRTRIQRELTSQDVDHHIVTPLRRLVAVLPTHYARWLTERCNAAVGTTMGFAPAHRDLTMVNVLFDGLNLGIIDWETAAAAAPPLIDLPYALADAVAACRHYDDRVAAFRECFDPQGVGMGGVTRSVLSQAIRTCGAPPAWLSFAFHACWLSHAVHDLDRRGEAAPFVGIVRALAADPVRYDPFAS